MSFFFPGIRKRVEAISKELFICKLQPFIYC